MIRDIRSHSMKKAHVILYILLHAIPNPHFIPSACGQLHVFYFGFGTMESSTTADTIGSLNVEESRAKRLERQQARLRDRGG